MSLPAGWRLRPDPRTRVLAGGTILAGGSPFRVLTLSERGARIAAAWWRGEPIGAAGDLARRLVDAGLAHPEPVGGPPRADLTVVVPVRDRPADLRRCLAALGDGSPVIVVDDGSDDGGAIAAAAAGATVLRLDPPRGPSAARNAGAAAATTPFVAFVDSDCVVGAGWPDRLLGHLGDERVAVAAPRIVALDPGGGVLARYEAAHSALDMGPSPGAVRSGTAVPYVPSAALVARRTALGAGFDETLSIGEDVDLVWRLADAGWIVRYDPACEVAHDHRVRLRPWFARRVTYNTSNAALVRRHPGKIPAVSLSRGGAAFWGAALAGRPAISVAVAVVGGIRLRRRLRGRVPGGERLVVAGLLVEGRFLARALTGPWLPVALAVAAVRPRAGRRLWLGILAANVAELPPRFLAPKAVEDVARCIGVWRGCLQERSVRALLPELRAV